MNILKQIIFSIMSLTIIDSNLYAQSFQDGDLIFQTSTSKQSKLLESTTNSKYTHVGIIVKEKNSFYVTEASSVVKITPLEKFIAKGKNEKYMVLRSKEVNQIKIEKMKEYAKKQIGKKYDLKFQWNDNKMYCSELVWKIYNHAGIKLTNPKMFKDFNISSDLAKKEILKRFKGSAFSTNELVVAPVDITQNKNLDLVFTNY